MQNYLVGLPSDTAFPATMKLVEWTEIGRRLGEMERHTQWWIGEWWMFGAHAFGQAKATVTAADWDGPTYQTCIHAATCCRKFPPRRRRPLVPFSHHMEAASLPADQADKILDVAQRQAETTGKPLSSRFIRSEVKKQRRSIREVELAESTEQASRDLGSTLYSVIYADPPWQFEPYSRDSGLDRAADNHYPTLTVEDLYRIVPPAADDCALFLWATAPMLREALSVLTAWGFFYKSHFIWAKDRIGTGYWARNRHELLLIATRGNVPAPAPGEQFESVILNARSQHSRKPEVFAEMIEQMFPSARLLEMFARTPRTGWDVWGNEVERHAAEL